MKEENDRKKELIKTLKNSSVQEEENKMQKSKIDKDSVIAEVQEKLKEVQKDLSRKEGYLRETKSLKDTLKNELTAKENELEQLAEKNKQLKNEVARKDLIIKDLRTRVQEDKEDSPEKEENQNKMSVKDKETIKKLKIEIDRQTSYIKTLKCKVDAGNVELSQSKLKLESVHKDKDGELEIANKNIDKLKRYLLETKGRTENCQGILKCIFKDILFEYDKLKAKLDEKEASDYNDAIEILGLSWNDLNEFLSAGNKVDLYSSAERMIEKPEENYDALVKLFATVKEKVIDMTEKANKDRKSEKQGHANRRLFKVNTVK